MSTQALDAALADIGNDSNALDARQSADDAKNLGPCVQFAFNGAEPQPDEGSCNNTSAEECIRQIGGVRPPLLPRLRELLKAHTKAKKPLPAKPGDPTQPDDHWIASQIGTTAQTLRKLDRPFRKMIKDAADEVGLEPSSIPPRRKHRSVPELLDQWEQGLTATGRLVPASQVRPDEPDVPRIEREIDVGGGVLSNPKMPYHARILAFAKKHGLEKISQIVARPMNLSELKATACRTFEGRLIQEGKDKNQIENALSNLKWACGVAESYSQGGTLSAAAAIAAAIADRSKQPKADRVVSELNKLLFIVEAADLSAGLPQEFALALKISIDRSSMSLAMIARQVDIDKTVLRDWTTGRRNPTAESVKVVPKIEELLCLPTGTLSDRHRLTRRNHTTPIRVACSDQDADDEQYAFPFDWGKKGLRTDRPTRWPVALAAQRDAFFGFRIDPLAPSDKRRDPDATPWQPQSVTMRDQQLGRLFGYIASDLGAVDK